VGGVRTPLHERHGADHAGEQQHAHQVERQQHLAVEDVGDRGGGAAL
jgi:hypothetical protein